MRRMTIAGGLLAVALLVPLLGGIAQAQRPTAQGEREQREQATIPAESAPDSLAPTTESVETQRTLEERIAVSEAAIDAIVQYPNIQIPAPSVTKQSNGSKR